MVCKGVRPESKVIPALRAAQIFRLRVIQPWKIVSGEGFIWVIELMLLSFDLFVDAKVWRCWNKCVLNKTGILTLTKNRTSVTRHFIHADACAIQATAQENASWSSSLSFPPLSKARIDGWRRKTDDGHYDIKKNMCSLLLTARASSFWPSQPALCMESGARRAQLLKIQIMKNNHRDIQ